MGRIAETHVAVAIVTMVTENIGGEGRGLIFFPAKGRSLLSTIALLHLNQVIGQFLFLHLHTFPR